MSCKRCGGFKVFDYFYGLQTLNGFRNVNCGAITDMRIVLPTEFRTVHASRTRMKRHKSL